MMNPTHCSLFISKYDTHGKASQKLIGVLWLNLGMTHHRAGSGFESAQYQAAGGSTQRETYQSVAPNFMELKLISCST